MRAGRHTGEIVVHAGDVYTFARDGRRLDTRRIPFQTETRCGIAVDAAGYVYVVGAPDHRVHKVDRDGRVLASFGRGRGEGDGELFDPRSASLSTLRAYVADWVRERGRVHAFAPDGSHLGTWSIGDDGQWLRSPQGLAVDTQGRLVVADRDLPAPMTITQGAMIPEESLCTVYSAGCTVWCAGLGTYRFLKVREDSKWSWLATCPVFSAPTLARCALADEERRCPSANQGCQNPRGPRPAASLARI